MVFDYSKLRGRIVEIFGSQSKFADHLGVARQTINAKLSGTIEITKKDIVNWSEALDIAGDEIGLYFFTEKVSEVKQ